MKLMTCDIDMKPSGSVPQYWNPGSRACQFGVRSRSESQRSRMDRSVRQRLIARPEWPAPMTTVVTVRAVRRGG
jgi:hypothetical protein